MVALNWDSEIGRFLKEKCPEVCTEGTSVEDALIMARRKGITPPPPPEAAKPEEAPKAKRGRKKKDEEASTSEFLKSPIADLEIPSPIKAKLKPDAVVSDLFLSGVEGASLGLTSEDAQIIADAMTKAASERGISLRFSSNVEGKGSEIGGEFSKLVASIANPTESPLDTIKRVIDYARWAAPEITRLVAKVQSAEAAQGAPGLTAGAATVGTFYKLPDGRFGRARGQSGGWMLFDVDPTTNPDPVAQVALAAPITEALVFVQEPVIHEQIVQKIVPPGINMPDPATIAAATAELAQIIAWIRSQNFTISDNLQRTGEWLATIR